MIDHVRSGQPPIDRFVRVGPHRTGMAAIRSHMLPPTFVLWSVRARDLPIGWHEAKVRVREEESQCDGSQTVHRNLPGRPGDQPVECPTSLDREWTGPRQRRRRRWGSAGADT